MPSINYPYRFIETAFTISGSWFRASTMTTMNKNQPDAQ
jgi:hypothetical protein